MGGMGLGQLLLVAGLLIVAAVGVSGSVTAVGCPPGGVTLPGGGCVCVRPLCGGDPDPMSASEVKKEAQE